ncbi:hypothetical protein OG979_25160 [Actinomadura citrea]|uniref:hypothetical protein n=1 Tax=Actinomadura citrea TaxID=46158 RepID=UPI002E2AD765|nr:hypothetical protein [Actinomadura citrea]
MTTSRRRTVWPGWSTACSSFPPNATEVDGKHHYADKDTASPRLYSEMVAEDRELRLYGYEVYRFGGYELMQEEGVARDTLRGFFAELLRRHGVGADEGDGDEASS